MARFEVKAELAGMVAVLDAEVGSAVERDGVVMTLESMKMQIPVLAPRAGTLVQILVAEGEAVQEGQRLAVLEI